MHSVSNPTSPDRGLPTSTKFTSHKKAAPTVWPVADLFSTNGHKQTTLLNTIIDQRNHIIHNLENEAWLEAYLKNEKLLHAKIQSYSTESIKSQFKSYVPTDARALFIHIICDVAHKNPQAEHVCLAADYLLEKKIDRLSTYSFAKQKNFLSPTKSEFPIQTIYKKTEATLHPVMAPGAFGNILFRFSVTEDIVFSPVFMSYLNKTPQARFTAIDPQKNSWATLQDDDMFLNMGLKKLTDRDAVAHYRWLTEEATPEEFSEYLVRVGTTPAPESDSPENRKATLQLASSHYWTGHYVIQRPHESPFHKKSGNVTTAPAKRSQSTTTVDEASLFPPIPIDSTNHRSTGPQRRNSWPPADFFPSTTYRRPDNEKFPYAPSNRYVPSDGTGQDHHDMGSLRFGKQQYFPEVDYSRDDSYFPPENSRGYRSQRGPSMPTHIYDQDGRKIEIHHHHHYYSGPEKHTFTQDAQNSPIHQQRQRSYRGDSSAWQRHANSHTSTARHVSHEFPPYVQARPAQKPVQAVEKLPIATPVIEKKLPIATPVVEEKAVYITPRKARKSWFFIDTVQKRHKSTLYKLESFSKKLWSSIRGQ